MDATHEEREPVRLVVDEDGRLIVPAAIVEAAGLAPGESVEIEFTLPGILLVPIRTDAEMEAFWGPNWRADIDASLEDVLMGRTTRYYSTEEFLASLEARRHADVR